MERGEGKMTAVLGAILAPFIGSLLIILLSKWPNPREAISIITSIITFLLIASAVPGILAGGTSQFSLFSILPNLDFKIGGDGLGILFAAISSFLWILTTIYSVGYMRGLKEHAQTRYYCCFAVAMGATLGIALSANLFTLFIFYEILTISVYPLVIHKETDEALKAGKKYLFFTLGGGLAILAGLVLVYSVAGTTDFAAGGMLGQSMASPDVVRLIFFLLIAGFGVKASIMPLHPWLPSAMVAPTPVSGFLHAVAVVKAGVFGVLRVIFFIVGPSMILSLGLQFWLILFASITILVGSFIALAQDDFKRRLAYSTISQLSYIILGAALLTSMGVMGALFQIAAHAFAKLTMFFVAGAVRVKTGKTKISELAGIGKKMPLTMLAFTLAALSMVGLPLMPGFISKFYLSAGAWDANQLIVIFVLVISSILNAAYFFPIIFTAFSGDPEKSGAKSRIEEAHYAMVLPILITIICAIILGLWTSMPDGPFKIAEFVTKAVLPGSVLP
ncbi:MAG: monovalent cation/H+ antiporter subunit D family protein [Candidatus Diapherotrites archaeon]|nr:monovalent cation/H+ antiporter subunit D family protein [Candidatus Diapherotrites archaeon]